MEFNLLYSLAWFSITFLLIILIYMVFINRKRKNMKTEGSFTEPSYLFNRFNLSTRKISYKKVMWLTTFLNAFIIALTASVVVNIKSLLLELLVGFVMLLVLIFLGYEVLGRILVARGYTKGNDDERSE